MKPMAPGSIFHHTSLRSIILFSNLLFCYLLLSDLKTKIPKIFTLPFVYFHLSPSDLTFASNREGMDNPFIALGASCVIVCAGIR